MGNRCPWRAMEIFKRAMELQFRWVRLEHPLITMSAYARVSLVKLNQACASMRLCKDLWAGAVHLGMTAHHSNQYIQLLSLLGLQYSSVLLQGLQVLGWAPQGGELGNIDTESLVLMANSQGMKQGILRIRFLTYSVFNGNKMCLCISEAFLQKELYGWLY